MNELANVAIKGHTADNFQQVRERFQMAPKHVTDIQDDSKTNANALF